MDLGAPYEVYNVNLYHRTDCCQDRLVGAHIIVSGSADYTHQAHSCWESAGVAQTQTLFETAFFSAVPLLFVDCLCMPGGWP